MNRHLSGEVFILALALDDDKDCQSRQTLDLMTERIKLCLLSFGIPLLMGSSTLAQEPRPAAAATQAAAAENPVAETAGPAAKVVDPAQRQTLEKELDDLQVQLAQSPQDPVLLTNTGIAAARLERWGLAAGLLRDAVEVDPGLAAAQQALDFVLEKLPVKEIARSADMWEVYRAEFLSGISLYALFIVGAPLLLLVGLLALRFVTERRKALVDEDPLPRITWIHVLATFLLVIHVGLLLTKLIDRGQTRATITAEKILAHSAPDAEAPALFELFAGLEVLILRENEQWLQVRYPGGSAGWIERRAVRISALATGGG